MPYQRGLGQGCHMFKYYLLPLLLARRRSLLDAQHCQIMLGFAKNISYLFIQRYLFRLLAFTVRKYHIAQLNNPRDQHLVVRNKIKLDSFILVYSAIFIKQNRTSQNNVKSRVDLRALAASLSQSTQKSLVSAMPIELEEPVKNAQLASFQSIPKLQQYPLYLPC